MLYIVLPLHVYTVITRETVDSPAEPGAIPPYLHGVDASTNHVILLTWQNQKEGPFCFGDGHLVAAEIILMGLILVLPC